MLACKMLAMRKYHSAQDERERKDGLCRKSKPKPAYEEVTESFQKNKTNTGDERNRKYMRCYHLEWENPWKSAE